MHVIIISDSLASSILCFGRLVLAASCKLMAAGWCGSAYADAVSYKLTANCRLQLLECLAS